MRASRVASSPMGAGRGAVLGARGAVLGARAAVLGPGDAVLGARGPVLGALQLFCPRASTCIGCCKISTRGSRGASETSAPAARGAAARARRSTEEQAAEPRAAGTQPLHSPERTDMWFVVLLVYACQLVVHVDGTAASTAAELCRAVRAAAAAAAAGLGSPACFARSSPCSVEQWVLLSQYSKVQHLESRLTSVGVSFDEGSLPVVEGGPASRPAFGADMAAAIDDHQVEHGKSKSNHKCGENKAVLDLIKADVAGWQQQADEAMRYVSALGQLLVRTHDASGH
jgi:hypothetical protein